jgi:hypothetical protein
VGTLGVEVMDVMAFSPSSWNNSTIDANQITFGTIDFRPHHPPTLVPVFATLNREMDLMIGTFTFHVGSLGSLQLSDPVYSDPLARKTADATTSETSVGSSSEPNSPVSIRPVENKKSIVKPLDKIMENIGFKESSDQSFSSSGSEQDSANIINYSE